MVLGPLSLGASAGDRSRRSNLAQTFCPGAGTVGHRPKKQQKRRRPIMVGGRVGGFRPPDPGSPRRRFVKTGSFLLHDKRESVTAFESGPQHVSSAGFPQPPPPWRLWPGRSQREVREGSPFRVDQ